jgi:hypothetical protein
VHPLVPRVTGEDAAAWCCPASGAMIRAVGDLG